MGGLSSKEVDFYAVSYWYEKPPVVAGRIERQRYFQSSVQEVPQTFDSEEFIQEFIKNTEIDAYLKVLYDLKKFHHVKLRGPKEMLVTEVVINALGVHTRALSDPLSPSDFTTVKYNYERLEVSIHYDGTDMESLLGEAGEFRES